jgi:hypothetical protein
LITEDTHLKKIVKKKYIPLFWKKDCDNRKKYHMIHTDRLAGKKNNESDPANRISVQD